jgi:S-layer homology domain
MTRIGPTLSTAVLLAAAWLAAPVARAQSYGGGDQLLTVGAPAFRSLDAFGTAIDAVGYLRHGGEDVHLAPLPLPEGAWLDYLCVYADDSDPDPAKLVRAHVVAIKQVAGGQSSALKVVGAEVYSSDLGYYKSCAGISRTLHGMLDVDDDGAPDPVAYYVHVEFPSGPIPLGVGAVEIAWRREVSPGLTQTFADVPASDPAYDHIEALAASGITAGCAGGNYCPDANLTRRQMAVFLAKALGLHWPN